MNIRYVKRKMRAHEPVVLVLLLSTSVILSTSVTAQTRDQPQVSIVFAVLTKSVESKSAVVGQELILRTINDVIVDKEVVIPRDSTLLGHVAGVAGRGKDQSQTRLAIVIDKAIRARGGEIPLQAIIAAVGAPQNTSLKYDPTSGKMSP